MQGGERVAICRVEDDMGAGEPGSIRDRTQEWSAGGGVISWIEPKVVHAARLSSVIQLVDVAFQLIRAELTNAPRGRLSYKQELISAVWRRDNAKLTVVFPFRLTLSSIDDGKTEEIGSISMNIRAQYELQEGFSDDMAEDLPHALAVLGFMHTWPYIRAEVQGLTSRLELPALTLPVMVSGHAEECVRIASESRHAEPDNKTRTESPSDDRIGTTSCPDRTSRC
jgi:hypothetical protein